MATLNQIALSGFAGTAPTPVEKRAINEYLVKEGLFNIMPYVNIGRALSNGNIAVDVLTYDEADDIDFRSIGEEYENNNNVPTPVTFYLKQLGGEFSTDRVLQRSFSKDATALDNWTEQQISQKIYGIINAFSKAFIQGDSATNPKSFDGLNKFLAAHPEQVEATYELEGGLTFNNALGLETYVNTLFANLAYAPSAIITTRAGGALLKSLESYRGRGYQVINVNDRAYASVLGVPVIELRDDAFASADLSAGIPVYAVWFDEQRGIHCAVPQEPAASGGQILDIVRPRMGANDAGEAVFVRNGGVELCGVPVIVNPYSVSKGIIATTTATAGE